MGLRRTEIGELFTRVMTLFKKVLRNYLLALGALEDGLHKGIETNEYQVNYSFSCLNNLYNLDDTLLVFDILLLSYWTSDETLLPFFDM